MPKSALARDQPPRPDKATYLRPLEKDDALALHEQNFRPTTTEKDELHASRVHLIFEMMQEHRWLRAKAVRDLSAIWGVSKHMVAVYEAEAKRAFRFVIGDPEEARGMYVSQLETIVADAMNAEVPIVDKETGAVTYARKPDHKSAISGIIAAADLLGLKSKKVIHKHEIDELSLEETLERAQKVLQEESIVTTGKPTQHGSILDVGFGGDFSEVRTGRDE